MRCFGLSRAVSKGIQALGAANQIVQFRRRELDDLFQVFLLALLV
jgi:hypothetical protein